MNEGGFAALTYLALGILRNRYPSRTTVEIIQRGQRGPGAGRQGKVGYKKHRVRHALPAFLRKTTPPPRSPIDYYTT
jgi:hypothetical protein